MAPGRAPASGLAALLACFLLPAVAGCLGQPGFSSPSDRCPPSVLASWQEPGLFAAFPPETSFGSAAIPFDTSELEGGPYRLQSVSWSPPSGNGHVTLAATEKAGTFLLQVSVNHVPAGERERLVERFLEALDVGPEEADRAVPRLLAGQEGTMVSTELPLTIDAQGLRDRLNATRPLYRMHPQEASGWTLAWTGPEGTYVFHFAREVRGFLFGEGSHLSGIMVGPDDRVHFSFHRKLAPDLARSHGISGPDAAAQALARSLFAERGLPTPRFEAWRLDDSC
ncbi:MAG TPA: hypothetical protein VNZ52_08975 [Candidatus Thermoplasmatota archaeon]|nr:hypothetical protein [Candidatus Thermoplasmatota archaeon]